ncbi:hypothetical protein ACEPAF_7950 [Sanghuangporus sanghuang]
MSEPATSKMLFTITKLNDSNYSVWKHDITPAEAVQLWEEKAEQAAGLIYQRIEHSMQVMVQDYIDDPVKM